MDVHKQQDKNATKLRQQSIGTRLHWSYLISSTLPLILVGVLLILLNFYTQRDRVYNEQILLSTQGVRTISTYVSSIEAQLLSTSQSMDENTSVEEWEFAIREVINANFPNLKEISVFDTAGIEMMRFASSDMDFSEPLKPTDDPMVELALNGLGRRSNIFEDDDGSQVFLTTIPLRNVQRKSVGVIRAKVSTNPILQSLRLLGRTNDSIAYLVNDKHEMMLEGSTTDWTPSENLPDILGSEEQYLQYQQDNSRVLAYKRNNKERVLVAISPITPGTWSVIVEQPVKIAFGNVWNTMLLLGVLVSVVGLIALGWGLFQANSILQPLRTLREGAESLGSGQLDHRIKLYTRDEMEQLADTLNQMAERLQVSLSEIAEQNRNLREGLRLARDIQMGLLPSKTPWDNSVLTVHSCSIPASEVGGDFYSYLSLSHNHIGISIGDISGKGVGAALMMALTSSMIESQARQFHNSADVLAGLNQLLYTRLRTNHMNAALIYAMFDVGTQTMMIANAGMISPLLIRRNSQHQDSEKFPNEYLEHHAGDYYTCGFLDVGGLPIGSISEIMYHNITVQLFPDDTLIFMSDGIVEAHNEKGEMFGFERIEQIFDGVQNMKDVSNVVDHILTIVKDFIGNAEQHDDITIVAVRPGLKKFIEGRKREEQHVYASL